LDLEVIPGSFTVLIGPNACGKSTLLRTMARILKPSGGQVVLDGADIARQPTKAVARRLGLLPQSPVVPQGVSVFDLVARGRAPHQNLLQQFSQADRAVVQEAMAATGVSELAMREVDSLSGGQRQRAWIAMALAQQTSILLLDEPTTYLDLAHQIDVLDLCADLHASGVTLVLVLHDINLAARYATHLVVMKEGRLVRQGAPGAVLTPACIAEVFGLACSIIADPATGTPLVVPDAPRPSRPFLPASNLERTP
jgi:iron complex transport system ATP-binding protein